MPSSSAQRNIPLCFTGKTALQVIRAALVAGHALVPSTRRLAPGTAPRQDEVLATMERVEAEIVGLHFDLPVQLLVGTHVRCRPTARYAAQTCSHELPAGSFLRVVPGVYVATPALCLVRAAGAGAASDAALLELGYELCATYASARTESGTFYNTPALATVSELHRYATRCVDVKGARKVERLVGYVADGSASPRETKLALLLALPHRMGGYGLGVPQMNYEVTADGNAQLISGRRSFRCDVCFPGARVDIEYQSREVHGNETSRISDSRRENALKAMGWTVINITNDELASMAATDVIAKTIAGKVGKRMRVRVADYRDRQLCLRAELGLPIDAWALH